MMNLEIRFEVLMMVLLFELSMVEMDRMVVEELYLFTLLLRLLILQHLYRNRLAALGIQQLTKLLLHQDDILIQTKLKLIQNDTSDNLTVHLIVPEALLEMVGQSHLESQVQTALMVQMVRVLNLYIDLFLINRNLIY